MFSVIKFIALALILCAGVGTNSPLALAAPHQGERLDLPASPTTDLFNAAKEFPNFFLPEKFRNTRIETLNAGERAEYEIAIAKSQDLAEKALQAIFSRLVVPIIEPGSSAPQSVRYFGYIEKKLRAIDPTAKIMPSGGVVRSAWGLLYEQIFLGMEATPRVSPEVTLKKIANFQHKIFDKSGNISVLDVKGVGSDFDLSLFTKPEKYQMVQEAALKITNSAYNQAARSGVTPSKTEAQAVYTIGDISSYGDVRLADGNLVRYGQITHSVAEGGSDIDFLAFDVDTGKLLEPPGKTNVVKNLLAGFVSYEKGSSAGSPKQVFRGLRALTEIPYLLFKNNAQYLTELDSVKQAIEAGELPDKSALSQIAKLVRNARFSGAFNRLLRSRPDSPEAKIKEICDLLAKKLFKEDLRELVTIPEMVERFVIGNQKPRSLNDMPKELRDSAVMDKNQFLAKYAVDGHLYHGSPNLEAALSIGRGSFRVSTYREGISRGTFATPNMSVAHGYAHNGEGLVFKLDLKNLPINVFDYRIAAANPWFKNLEKKAAKLGVHVADLLARDYGIDLIILDNEQVLIKNSYALEDLTFDELLRGYERLVFDQKANSVRRAYAFATYKNLWQQAQAMGKKAQLPHQEGTLINEFLSIVKSDSSVSDKLAAAEAIEILAEKYYGEHQESIIKQLVKSSPNFWKEFAQERLKVDGDRYPFAFIKILADTFKKHADTQTPLVAEFRRIFLAPSGPVEERLKSLNLMRRLGDKLIFPPETAVPAISLLPELVKYAEKNLPNHSEPEFMKEIFAYMAEIFSAFPLDDKTWPIVLKTLSDESIPMAIRSPIVVCLSTVKYWPPEAREFVHRLLHTALPNLDSMALHALRHVASKFPYEPSHTENPSKAVNISQEEAWATLKNNVTDRFLKSIQKINLASLHHDSKTTMEATLVSGRKIKIIVVPVERSEQLSSNEDIAAQLKAHFDPAERSQMHVEKVAFLVGSSPMVRIRESNGGDSFVLFQHTDGILLCGNYFKAISGKSAVPRK